MGKAIHRLISIFFGALLLLASSTSYAQIIGHDGDTIRAAGKSNVIITPDSVAKTVVADTSAVITTKEKKEKFDYKGHSPKKATWMSAALPSLGQFYNRRYWKPPIVYVGLGVAVYFLVDNQLKFIVARNSYRARLLVPGYTVNTKYESLSNDQILADRDFYRTNRDYSIIAIGGVYLLNIIDAAVDAHLRTFDVSDDLSMKIRPSFQYTSISMQNGFAPMPGLAWSIKF